MRVKLPLIPVTWTMVIIVADSSTCTKQWCSDHTSAELTAV